MDPLHSFGGHALDRWILEFESTPDGAGGEAGAGLSPDTAAGAGEGVNDGEGDLSSAPETDTAPAWTPDDPAFIDAVEARAAEVFQTQFGHLMPLLSQLAGDGSDGGDGSGGSPDFDWGQVDPLDDGFGQHLATGIAAVVQKAVQPLQTMIERLAHPLVAREEAERDATGNERVEGWIADELTRNGAVGEKAKAQIRPLAEALLPEFAEKYGNGPRAAEAATRKAVATIRDLVSEARTAGVQQHEEHIDALAGVRGDAGAGAGSGVVTLGDKPLSSRELAMKYGGRAHAHRG